MSRTRNLWNSTVAVPFPLWLLANAALWAWVIMAVWWIL